MPRRLGVVKKNKLLTSAAKRYRQQYDAEGDESDAFRDLLVCGISWTENRLDDEDNPEGDPLGCNPQETDPFNSRGEQEDRKPSNINAGLCFKIELLVSHRAMRECRKAIPALVDWLGEQ